MMNLKLKHAVLAFSFTCLAACGGSGGGGGSSGAPAAAAPAPTDSKVFVAYSVSSPVENGVASFTNPNPGAGSFAIDRKITGSATGITTVSPGALFLDSGNNRLYVINFYTVQVFNNASTANGNVAPARTIRISTNNPLRAIYVDVANDILYVTEDHKIWIYDNASTLSGTPVANRSIVADLGASSTNTSGLYPFYASGLFVDGGRNQLYVVGQFSGLIADSGPKLLVFNNAKTANGTLVPSRMVNLPNSAGSVSYPYGLFVDAARDRAFVSNMPGNSILVFDTVSTANGNTSANRVMNIGRGVKNLAMNTAVDRLYGVTNTSVVIINNASTATGTVAAVEALAPTGASTLSIAVAP